MVCINPNVGLMLSNAGPCKYSYTFVAGIYQYAYKLYVFTPQRIL